MAKRPGTASLRADKACSTQAERPAQDFQIGAGCHPTAMSSPLAPNGSGTGPPVRTVAPERAGSNRRICPTCPWCEQADTLLSMYTRQVCLGRLEFSL